MLGTNNPQYCRDRLASISPVCIYSCFFIFSKHLPMKRSTFICYTDWYDYCDGMSPEQKANLFDCIRSYTSEYETIQPLPEIQFVRNRIKKQLDEHNEKYIDTCKKASDNIKKRRDKAKSKDNIPSYTTVYEGIPNILDTDTDTDTDTVIPKGIVLCDKTSSDFIELRNKQDSKWKLPHVRIETEQIKTSWGKIRKLYTRDNVLL